MHIPSSLSLKAGSESTKHPQNISRQRKIFSLVKSIGLFAGAVCLSLTVSSCAQSGQPFGMYQNNPFTVEFAYSKTFLTNGDLPAGSAKDDKNTNMIEGWYAIEGDKIRCQYTKSKDEQSVTYNLTFSYDKEQDSLTLIEAQLPPADENNQPWPITTSQDVYEKVKS